MKSKAQNFFVHLIEAILFTKFKGKAMMDFRTRDIINFEQLKRELEKKYLSKRSTAHLQLEFNLLKQKPNENTQEFGRRTDNIAMELYKSMEEGKNHTVEQQRAILENIKEQAFYKNQNSLHEEIKLIVRSQRYQTIQEAIAEAKTRGPSTRTLTYRNRPIIKTQSQNPHCNKCGKIGHYGHDCRTTRFTNRYTLPRPEGQPRINTIEKQYSYCKKIGHLRHECWILNGKPENSRKNSKKIFSNSQRENPAKNFKSKKSEIGESKPTIPRPASKYRVAHVKATSLANTELNAITLPITEATGRKINFLFDTGASIIKLKHLLDHVLIYEEKTKLTGITGHEIITLGKTHITVQLSRKKVRHSVYIVRDNAPMEYDAILGADFIWKYIIAFNPKTNSVQFKNTKFKLYPYRRVTLGPRSETIVQVTTNQTFGLTKPEEMIPGIFIGCCLVEP
ncbi:hypothetical protein P5V15_012672 [Pogonomyrmex californicus]